MARTPQEDLAKLPRWARSRIENLERQVDTLSEQLNVCLNSDGLPSDLRVRIGPEIAFRSLPKHSTVRFGEEPVRQWIDTRMDNEDQDKISILVMASTPLVTIPISSNRILIATSWRSWPGWRPSHPEMRNAR